MSKNMPINNKERYRELTNTKLTHNNQNLSTCSNVVRERLTRITTTKRDDDNTIKINNYHLENTLSQPSQPVTAVTAQGVSKLMFDVNLHTSNIRFAPHKPRRAHRPCLQGLVCYTTKRRVANSGFAESSNPLSAAKMRLS